MCYDMWGNPYNLPERSPFDLTAEDIDRIDVESEIEETLHPSEKKKLLGEVYVRNPNDDTWFAFVHADDNEPLEELPPFWKLVVAYALDNPLAFYIPKALNIFEPVDKNFTINNKIDKRGIIKYKDFPQLMSAKSYEEWEKLKALAEVIKYLRRVKASYGTGANIVATILAVLLMIAATILAVLLTIVATLILKKIVKKLVPFAIVFLILALFRMSCFQVVKRVEPTYHYVPPF